MTPVEIAYFKHFMFDKDLARSFQHLYRTRRILGSPRGDKDANPESIEEYFMKTSSNDVIMKAFYFAPTNNNAQRLYNTYDYWKDIDDKWQEYMKQNESNFSNDSWPQLRKTFAILRQNWDAPGYWKKENLESTEEVYERMHIDLPLPDFIWLHGDVPPQAKRNDAEQIAVNIHNAKDGDVLVRVRKNDEGDTFRMILLFRELITCEVDGVNLHKAMTYCNYNIHSRELRISDENHGNIWVYENNPNVCFRLAFEGEKNLLMKKLEEEGLKWDETEMAIIPLDKEEATDQPLVDFTDEEDDPLADFDFLDDVLPSNYRLKSGEISINFNKGNKITFNQIDSKVIRESGLKYARLAKNKAGEICLILNNQKGANITKARSGRGNINVTINSADICGKIKMFFSLKNTYSILQVEKLQATQEFFIYKISKQK